MNFQCAYAAYKCCSSLHYVICVKLCSKKMGSVDLCIIMFKENGLSVQIAVILCGMFESVYVRIPNVAVLV